MPRSSWQITQSVWRALLLREALSRLFGRRTALVWMLLEPAANMAFFVFIYTVLHLRHVGGMDTTLWIVSGMLAFFLFKRTANQGQAAVGANLALYTYRQVKPIDSVLVRAFLEGLLMLVIATMVLVAAGLWGVPLQLNNPLMVMGCVLGLWLLGVAWGLSVSVVTELVPETGNLLGMLMAPLMLISGVVFPLSAINPVWREWVMLNPIAHGIEGVRVGIAPHYHAVPEFSLSYLFGFTLATLFFGLVLQVRFQRRLVAL